jgi:hypothetical protein
MLGHFLIKKKVGVNKNRLLRKQSWKVMSTVVQQLFLNTL